MKSKNLIFLCVMVFAILGIFETFVPKYSYSSQQTVKIDNMKQTDSNSVVTGTISYLVKSALPPQSVINIKLLDVSRVDAPAIEIASQTITTSGEQVPIPFELPFDPSKIKSQNSYVVRAEILINNNLAFTTTKIYPVITRGNGTSVDIILQRLASTSLADQLKGSKWLLEDLAGTGVVDRLQTTLEFGEENSLGGNGGCNRYFASYQLNDSNFSVGPIGSTFKMCPPAVMNQETAYLKALEQAQRLRIEGPYLLIDSVGLDKPLKFTRME